MIERCASTWKPNAPADLTFEVYMGISSNRVYLNILRQLTLCDVDVWKMYWYLGAWSSVRLKRSVIYGN